MLGAQRRASTPRKEKREEEEKERDRGIEGETYCHDALIGEEEQTRKRKRKKRKEIEA